MIGGSLQWGLSGVVRNPEDSTRTAEARRGDSGEACGKHETHRQTKALVVRQIVQGVLKQC